MCVMLMTCWALFLEEDLIFIHLNMFKLNESPVSKILLFHHFNDGATEI